MARFKSNKKKLYIGFIGEREAAEYIATSNIGPFTHFPFVCWTNISILLQHLVAFFMLFRRKSAAALPTTNLSSLSPRKKLDQMLGPFPLKFNLVQGEIGFGSMKRNRAPKKNYKTVSLEFRLPDKVQQTYFAFTFFVTFYPSPSSFGFHSMFFPQQYAAKYTETLNNMYCFDVKSE